MQSRHHTFDTTTATIGIAVISPIATLVAGIILNDIMAVGALIWCIAMSVITATRSA